VVFVAVAELRGFRAAARQLGVTPSAISQTIRALEQRVGAPLLSRTTRSVGLTEAGERLLVHARPAMEMLSLGLDAAASLGDDVSGRLRINLPRPVLPLLANRLLRVGGRHHGEGGKTIRVALNCLMESVIGAARQGRPGFRVDHLQSGD